MTRSDLIARIASRFQLLNAKDIEASVATILSAIGRTLARGGRVEVRGFGTFTLNHRPPRTGRNPKTGASVSIPEKRVPHFKPGTELRRRVDAAVHGAEPGRRGTVADHERVDVP